MYVKRVEEQQSEHALVFQSANLLLSSLSCSVSVSELCRRCAHVKTSVRVDDLLADLAYWPRPNPLDKGYVKLLRDLYLI